MQFMQFLFVNFMVPRTQIKAEHDWNERWLVVIINKRRAPINGNSYVCYLFIFFVLALENCMCLRFMHIFKNPVINRQSSSLLNFSETFVKIFFCNISILYRVKPFTLVLTYHCLCGITLPFSAKQSAAFIHLRYRTE